MQHSDLPVGTEGDVCDGRIAVTSSSVAVETLQANSELLLCQRHAEAAADTAAHCGVVIRNRSRVDAIAEEASDAEHFPVSPAWFERSFERRNPEPR